MRTVQQIMTKHVQTVNADMPVLDAVKKKCRGDIRHLIVTDGDGKPLGLISQRDIFKHLWPWIGLGKVTSQMEIVRARELMRSPLKTIGLDTTITSASHQMATSKIGCLVVLDQREYLAGLVTVTDMLSNFKQISASIATVGELMVSETNTIRPDATVLEAAKVMVESCIRHLVVMDAEGQVMGILSQHDVLQHLSPWLNKFDPEKPSPANLARVGDAMTHKVVHASTNMLLSKAATLMADHKIGCLPVLEEDGRLSGIITANDLLLHISR